MLRSDHTALAVKNLGLSREFYEFLGGRVVSKPSPHFIELLLGDLRLHIVRAPDPDLKQSELAPRIEHFCLSVDTTAELERLCDQVNGCELIKHMGPFEIQESPLLGASFADHAEQHPPRKTLYLRDPDGIMLEIRCYH